MRKILFAFLLCLPLFGCTETVKISSDELFAKMQESYKKMDSFHETSQVIVSHSKDGKVLSTIDMEFSFKRPDMYSMKIKNAETENKETNSSDKQKAPQTIIMCDGTFMFIKGADGNTTRIPGGRSVSEFYRSITARSFINTGRVITEYYLLDGKLSQEEFAQTGVGGRLEDAAGKPCYVLTIDFKNGDKQILYIDKENYTIRRNIVSIANPSKSRSDANEQTKSENQQPFLFMSDEKMINVEINPSLDMEVFRPIDMGKSYSNSQHLNSPGSKNELKGKKAPAFELKNESGKAISLDNIKNKVTVLVFWDPLYKPGFEDLKTLGEIYDPSVRDDLVVYAISDDSSELRDGTFKTLNLTFESLYDHEKKVSSAYGIDVVPSIIIIGKDGHVKDIFSGIQPKDTIAKALKNQGISVK